MSNTNIGFTENPSEIILVNYEYDQFVLVCTRKGSMITKSQINLAEKVINDIAVVDEKVQKVDFQVVPHHYVKLRSIMFDEKNGGLMLDIDYLHDDNVKPMFTEEELKELIGDGDDRYSGQTQSVEVSIKKDSFSSSSFYPTSSKYYNCG